MFINWVCLKVFQIVFATHLIDHRHGESRIGRGSSLESAATGWTMSVQGQAG